MYCVQTNQFDIFKYGKTFSFFSTTNSIIINCKYNSSPLQITNFSCEYGCMFILTDKYVYLFLSVCDRTTMFEIT